MAVGLVAYGISLTLFIVALRHIGTARAGAYYSVAPFFGALVAVALGDVLTGPLVVAGLLMALGVVLHLTEHHSHPHTHEATTHDHWHTTPQTPPGGARPERHNQQQHAPNGTRPPPSPTRPERHKRWQRWRHDPSGGGGVDVSEPGAWDLDVDDEPAVEPKTYYADVDEFFRGFLRPVYRRPINARTTFWAADWWRHPEAVLRLDAMWRSWEQARLDPATGMATWLRDIADYHMAILMSA